MIRLEVRAALLTPQESIFPGFKGAIRMVRACPCGLWGPGSLSEEAIFPVRFKARIPGALVIEVAGNTGIECRVMWISQSVGGSEYKCIHSDSEAILRHGIIKK